MVRDWRCHACNGHLFREKPPRWAVFRKNPDLLILWLALKIDWLMAVFGYRRPPRSVRKMELGERPRPLPRYYCQLSLPTIFCTVWIVMLRGNLVSLTGWLLSLSPSDKYQRSSGFALLWGAGATGDYQLYDNSLDVRSLGCMLQEWFKKKKNLCFEAATTIIR